MRQGSGKATLRTYLSCDYNDERGGQGNPGWGGAVQAEKTAATKALGPPMNSLHISTLLSGRNSVQAPWEPVILGQVAGVGGAVSTHLILGQGFQMLQDLSHHRLAQLVVFSQKLGVSPIEAVVGVD